MYTHKKVQDVGFIPKHLFVHKFKGWGILLDIFSCRNPYIGTITHFSILICVIC